MGRRMWSAVVIFTFINIFVNGDIDSEADFDFSEQNQDDSTEHIGPAVTQVFRHPYAASLLKNESYVCSAVILNTFWLLTTSKCFDTDSISSYVTHKNLANFTIRVGSSYNNKGGSIHKIKMLINNFDLKVSAVKLETPMVFGLRVQAAHLPDPDEEVLLGFLASLIAWTPTSHIRVVNVPVIEDSICDDSTKLLPGHFICVGGVQDPNRHFCRQDNGGAVIQNETLIGITAYLQTCALYTKTHAFPKVSSFVRWLDSVIWDEGTRPTTTEATTTTETAKSPNTTESTPSQSPYFVDPSKYLLTLPFAPVNVPLEPAEDNSVIPRMSLYESYLQNLAKARTSTTPDPKLEEKRLLLKKFGPMLKASPMYLPKKYDQYDYTNI